MNQGNAPLCVQIFSPCFLFLCRVGFPLGCYWVGSLDFNFLVETKVFSTKPNKSEKLFAGGVVTATELTSFGVRRLRVREACGTTSPCTPRAAGPRFPCGKARGGKGVAGKSR